MKPKLLKANWLDVFRMAGKEDESVAKSWFNRCWEGMRTISDNKYSRAEEAKIQLYSWQQMIFFPPI